MPVVPPILIGALIAAALIGLVTGGGTMYLMLHGSISASTVAIRDLRETIVGRDQTIAVQSRSLAETRSALVAQRDAIEQITSLATSRTQAALVAMASGQAERDRMQATIADVEQRLAQSAADRKTHPGRPAASCSDALAIVRSQLLTR